MPFVLGEAQNLPNPGRRLLYRSASALGIRGAAPPEGDFQRHRNASLHPKIVGLKLLASEAK